MTGKIIKSRLLNKIFYTLIPITTWIIITLPIWLSPFHPAVVAYFIIFFDLIFFYKAITTVYLATQSYKKLLFYSKTAFNKRVSRLKKSRDIDHFIIIPNFQEPLYKLESTVKSIINNDFSHNNLFLVFGFEEREKNVRNKARLLKERYRSYFKDILISYHNLVENEEPGKASNQTFAAKIVDRYIKKRAWRRENILITICDADSNLSTNYFSYLTYEYLRDKNHLYHFYWAPVLLYNNFWRLPFFGRIQATLSSILRLAFLSQKENLIQISTYSTSLWLLKKINFWDTDIIPEDWHLYLQAFFTFGEKIKTIPLYTIINGDAVYSGGIIKTFINRYEQERRWAWGVSDIGYAIKKFFVTPEISPLLKIKKIFFLAETHLIWPTSFFLLAISSSIPPLINPIFKKTVMGFILPKLSGLILTSASLMLLFYIYLDIRLRQRVSIQTRWRNLPLLIIQWYFLPIISFFLSSLPALESHTRIIFGKKIKYKVTEKV